VALSWNVKNGLECEYIPQGAEPAPIVEKRPNEAEGLSHGSRFCDKWASSPLPAIMVGIAQGSSLVPGPLALLNTGTPVGVGSDQT